MLLRPGVLIGGKYRLRARIGAGGMGVVWLAENQSTGADVAIKVLFGQDPKAAARLRQEGRTVARLVHPHIVTMYDTVEEHDGTLALVMEYLRGETLEQYLERLGPRPTAEAVSILLPILSGLQHAHENDVVHRDVKPSNIFLALDCDGKVVPKLVDFGISKAAGSPVETTYGRRVGTIAYMAPEQFRGLPVGRRADVFGLGLVLYKTLTGVLPFGSDEPGGSPGGVLYGIVPKDPRIDASLWPVLRRCLAKSPNYRHQSATELADDLRLATGALPPLDIAVEMEQPYAEIMAVEPATPGDDMTCAASPWVGPKRRFGVLSWVFASLAVLVAIAGTTTYFWPANRLKHAAFQTAVALAPRAPNTRFQPPPQAGNDSSASASASLVTVPSVSRQRRTKATPPAPSAVRSSYGTIPGF